MKKNQNIEWKTSWRDEYIKWICGFANAAGGTLVIGKNQGETREKILKLVLEDASISIEEMSNRIGITQKGIEWQIMRLKKDGILERIGPAKGGYWKTIKE